MKIKYYFGDLDYLTNSTKMLGMEDTHKPGYIGSIVTSCLLTSSLIVLLGLSHGSVGNQVFFNNRTTFILEEHEVMLTPDPWVFYVMWIVSCSWQVLWLLYGLSTIRRYTSYGYLYIAPGHMHPSMYITFSIGVASNIIWLFLFDLKRTDLSFPFAFLSSLFIYIADGISLKRLYIRGPVLQREEMESEIWLVRALVQNGLDLYATWMLFIALLNLNIFLVYSCSVSQYIAATIMLVILLVSITGFFFVDVFAIDRFSRYVLGGYFALAVPLAAAAGQHWVAGSSTETLLVSSVAVTVSLTLGKIIVIGWRYTRVPIWMGSSLFTAYKGYGSVDIYKEPSSSQEHYDNYY